MSPITVTRAPHICTALSGLQSPFTSIVMLLATWGSTSEHLYHRNKGAKLRKGTLLAGVTGIQISGLFASALQKP